MSAPLNIVIPMAGRGSRFSSAGYSVPKPLIQLGGRPMIQWVIDNVRPARPHRFIFICLDEHLRDYPHIPTLLKTLCPTCEIIRVDSVTHGAACTVLLARDYINTENPLMIANSDQFVEIDIDSYLKCIDTRRADGLIMTFWSDNPKWSYCRISPDGYVVEVREKQVISNEATVGIYNFSHGSDFVDAADSMIRLDLRTNNEFYVAPAYNLLIEAGARVIVESTGREGLGMHGLGTPEDMDTFKTTRIYSQRALLP